MSIQNTERIRIWGIVQGVGFRPFVAKLAERLGMRGTVLNIGGLVDITLTDTQERIDDFISAIEREKPEPAEIVHISREKMPHVDFHGFRILKSARGEDEAAMIPPDMAICPQCLRELYDDEDPRAEHPFISCMLCGPRYTIIDRIPYDRENTTMAYFPMCEMCKEQYDDIGNRRHHAQTISCHDCGPYLKWMGRNEAGESDETPQRTVSGSELTPSSNAHTSQSTAHTRQDDTVILDRAAALLKAGGVIAFKCVGGYNLVADPFSDEAISKLREIKGRDEKPFAIQFRDMDQIKSLCHVDPVEEKLLMSSARPIVLLEHRLGDTDFESPDFIGKRPGFTGEPSFDDTLRSRFIGAFLPSLAAQYLLLDRTGPLVFTSANRSDVPMIKDDEEMRAWFMGEPGIDAVVYNDRKIRVIVDDSVCRVIDGHPQMIRRSKGYAPLPLYIDTAASTGADTLPAGSDATGLEDDSASVFAAGGQLKNSFALTKGPFIYMSQYFGDMDSEGSQQIYEENVDRMSALFRIHPDIVACDMHPLYETTRFAEEYAKATDLPLVKIQHHHAHVASVMAENDLKGPVIGVSFDGTGYGTDGKIWGGEFLLCEGGDFERMSHLRYTKMIGGDSSMKDAHRSALSYLFSHQLSSSGLRNTQSELFGTFSELSESRPSSEDSEREPLAECSASNPCSEQQAESANCSDPDDEGCRQLDIDISDIIEYGGESLMGCTDARMIFKAIDAGINTIESSSMGRLFDAVSAFLGICDYNDYEGRCAIMLEDAAAFAQKHPGEDRPSDLALAFHNRVIDLIVDECVRIKKEKGADQVALTGGTFQNRILMEGCLDRLRKLGLRPYYNISVSPNDGGIALGQAYVALHKAGDI